MTILRLIASVLLTLLPVVVLIRDWKFHDKRTRKHHNITRTIIVVWLIASILASYFVLSDYSKLTEWIEGKNLLLDKIDKYQNDLKEKEEKIKNLETKARQAQQGITKVYYFIGHVRTTNGPDVYVSKKLVDDYKNMKNLAQSNNYENLKNLCIEQIEKNPEWPTPYLFLGLAYANTGEPEKAIFQLEHFLEIAPTTPSLGYGDHRVQAEQFLERLRNR